MGAWGRAAGRWSEKNLGQICLTPCARIWPLWPERLFFGLCPRIKRRIVDETHSMSCA
jgi:hypothetical protein